MNSPQPAARKVLLWLAAFILILFTTHLLLLHWHPFGPHRFFWNLALSALIFLVAVKLLGRWIKMERQEAGVSRAQTKRLRELFKL
jgi:hypothetical protein